MNALSDFFALLAARHGALVSFGTNQKKQKEVHVPVISYEKSTL
jgi:hypothetical protein